MKEIVVYAYVVADLLHVGHIIALENAKKYGDKLIVGVLTDEATMEKKQKPILSFEERIMLVKALKCVDLAVAQKTYSPISNIIDLKPDILMESDEHTKKDLEKTKKAAKAIGTEIVITPYYHGQCSSRIKDNVIKNWKGSNLKKKKNMKGGKK